MGVFLSKLQYVASTPHDSNNWIIANPLGDHPFKTSAFFMDGGWGGVVKNLPNLPTDCCKKLPMVGGRGQKSVEICRCLKCMIPSAKFQLV